MGAVEPSLAQVEALILDAIQRAKAEANGDPQAFRAALDRIGIHFDIKLKDDTG